MNGTIRRRDLSGDDLVAVTLKEYADSGSVSNVLHIEYDAILQADPRDDEHPKPHSGLGKLYRRESVDLFPPVSRRLIPFEPAPQPRPQKLSPRHSPDGAFMPILGEC